jgi:hypothetical protein
VAHVLMKTRIGQQDQAARQVRRAAAGFNHAQHLTAAIAFWLLSTRPVGRAGEFGSLAQLTMIVDLAGAVFWVIVLFPTTVVMLITFSCHASPLTERPGCFKNLCEEFST